MGVNLGLSQ